MTETPQKEKAFRQLANGIPDFARKAAKLFEALELLWGSPPGRVRVPDGVDIAMKAHELLQGVMANKGDGDYYQTSGRIRVEWRELTEDDSGHATMSFIFDEDFYGEEDE